MPPPPDDIDIDQMKTEALKLLADEMGGERYTFEIGPFSAYCLIGALQLALRHPKLIAQGSSSLVTALRHFIDGMAPIFDGTPAGELIRRGNDPRYDR